MKKNKILRLILFVIIHLIIGVFASWLYQTNLLRVYMDNGFSVINFKADGGVSILRNSTLLYGLIPIVSHLFKAKSFKKEILNFMIVHSSMLISYLILYVKVSLTKPNEFFNTIPIESNPLINYLMVGFALGFVIVLLKKILLPHS